MFSFSRHKKTVDLFPYIRRICDLTMPNLPSMAAGRSENRYNRTIPTLLCPWGDGSPQVDEQTICLTSDLSDHGVGLVLDQPFSAERAVVGYWVGAGEMSEPWFFLGNVVRNQPIGGGYWNVGIELKEFANTDHQPALEALGDAAARLLPPAEVPV